MSKHKRVFTAPVITTNENGETEVVEKEFAVIKPGLNLVQQANKLRNKIFNELFEDGGLLRQRWIVTGKQQILSLRPQFLHFHL